MEAYNKEEPECTFQPQTFSGSLILDSGVYINKPGKIRDFNQFLADQDRHKEYNSVRSQKVAMERENEKLKDLKSAPKIDDLS
jgi:hypothetical protein